LNVVVDWDDDIHVVDGMNTGEDRVQETLLHEGARESAFARPDLAAANPPLGHGL
jgi:uncharacterized membrane protein